MQTYKPGDVVRYREAYRVSRAGMGINAPKDARLTIEARYLGNVYRVTDGERVSWTHAENLQLIK